MIQLKCLRSNSVNSITSWVFGNVLKNLKVILFEGWVKVVFSSLVLSKFLFDFVVDIKLKQIFVKNPLWILRFGRGQLADRLHVNVTLITSYASNSSQRQAPAGSVMITKNTENRQYARKAAHSLTSLTSAASKQINGIFLQTCRCCI